MNNKKTLVIITSFDRKKMLYRLLKQLNHNDTIIFDDCSDFDFNLKYNFVRFEQNYGKKRCWLKFHHIFKEIPKNYDYFIFLPDDVEVSDTFIDDAINIYDGIDDEKKICLSLLTDVRVEKPNWTKFHPVKKGNVILTQWNDLCFICEKRFFDNVEIMPVLLDRWESNHTLSSGVGQQISIQLFKNKLNQYHVKKTLVHHGEHDSKMHYEHRKQTPIIC